MPRRQQVLAYAAFLVTLVAGSSQRLVGDGVEYFAMAWSLADAGRPSVSADDAAQVERALLDAAPESAGREVLRSARAGPDGRGDYVHFWLYSAVAAPLVRGCQWLGLTPTWGFVAVNLALLLAAFGAAAARLHPAVTVLIFAGPIIWWTDKVHAEVFTFSLLSIALLVMDRRPGWSMAAFGASAAQNPPLGLFLPLTLGAVWLGARAELRRVPFWVGAAVGLGLAATHPAYYEWRFGVPSLLVETTRRTWPSFAEIGAVLWDANVGLLVSYPVFVLVVVATAIALLLRARRTMWAPDVLVALLGGAALLVAFAQTSNVSHGGTPGMSRYALWLVPLALPILSRSPSALGASGARRLWLPAALSAIACVFAFHPRVPEGEHRPTWVAEVLWTRAPGASNPLPEVFAESFSRSERRLVPVSTPACEKALLVGRGEAQGMWPAPCYPAEIPEACRRPAQLCYANRLGRSYEFVQAAGNANDSGFRFDPRGVWGRPAEDAIRMVMNGVGWRALRATPVSAPEAMVRAVHGVAEVRLVEAHGRAVVAMIGTAEEARIALRPPGRTVADLIDGRSGERLGTTTWAGRHGELWEFAIPRPRDLVLLVLRPAGA